MAGGLALLAAMGACSEEKVDAAPACRRLAGLDSPADKPQTDTTYWDGVEAAADGAPGSIATVVRAMANSGRAGDAGGLYGLAIQLVRTCQQAGTPLPWV
ncbi:MAG: hypothetical protein ACRD2W_00400 [Acidimicrobiales bacterium]